MNREENKKLKSVVCAGIVILAIVGCATAPAAIVTTTYEFIPDQSTVVGTGVHSIEGQFQLTVDYDAGVASFDWVNTSDICVGDIFHMTELAGTVVSDTKIDFLLESSDPRFPDRDILVDMTFTDNSVHLASSTYYPLYAADASFYVLDAVAVPEPAALFLVSLGVLLLRRRN